VIHVLRCPPVLPCCCLSVLLPPIGNNCRRFCTNLVQNVYLVTDSYFRSEGVPNILDHSSWDAVGLLQFLFDQQKRKYPNLAKLFHMINQSSYLFRI
jgi:hypothetical protein